MKRPSEKADFFANFKDLFLDSFNSFSNFSLSCSSAFKHFTSFINKIAYSTILYAFAILLTPKIAYFYKLLKNKIIKKIMIGEKAITIRANNHPLIKLIPRPPNNIPKLIKIVWNF